VQDAAIFLTLPDHQSAKEGALRKHSTGKMVDCAGCPSMSSVFYWEVANRAQGLLPTQQATLNRAHPPPLFQLLEKPESKQLANLLATLRTNSPETPVREDALPPRSTMISFHRCWWPWSPSQRSWVREKQRDLPPVCVLIGDGIC